MKYIITQHARQRRRYKEVESEVVLSNFLIELDMLCSISTRKNALYKIAYKNICAIVKKETEQLILVTQRGFKQYNYDLTELIGKLKVSVTQDKDTKKQEDEKYGVEHEILRINYKGKLVFCGRILDIDKSKLYKNNPKLRGDFKFILELDYKLYTKYYLPKKLNKDILFNSVDEIMDIIHFENEKYMLNNFQRKKSRTKSTKGKIYE